MKPSKLFKTLRRASKGEVLMLPDSVTLAEVFSEFLVNHYTAEEREIFLDKIKQELI